MLQRVSPARPQSRISHSTPTRASSLIVDRITDAISGPVAVSRALHPEIRKQLLNLPGSSELPCVRGRTVIPDPLDITLVAGFPNYLGVFDDARGDRTILLTGRWSALRSVPEGVTEIALEDPAPGDVTARALADARYLVKRLRQVKGVQLAIRPQSPVVVALLPFSFGRGDVEVPGVTPLEGDFAEFPGGARIEIPFDDTGFDVTRYAAELEQVISEEA